jgi:hypothetical protein
MHSATKDFEHFWASWRLGADELKHFGIEMLLLLQFWPILALVSVNRGGRFAKAALASALLIFLSTVSFRLPAVPRLYLPVLAILASAVSPAFLSWPRHTKKYGIITVAIVCSANIAAMIAGTFY